VRLLFLRIAFMSLPIVPAWSHGSLLQNTCADQLDSAVSAYNNGKASNKDLTEGQVEELFAQLKQDCDHLPQVHHNLGVMAAEAQQWDQAIEHFQRATANDTRTNMTQTQLLAIHQYKAALAYKNALGAASLRTAKPEFRLQDSDDKNQAYSLPPKSELHSVSTVDYELYSWWQSAGQASAADWLEHYTPGYPPAESDDAKIVSWTDVARDISFTAQDAVVVLSYQVDNIEKRTLLLMRLQNNRWKIYRETTL